MLPWRLEIDPPQFPSVTMYSNESGNASVNASVAANARCGIALTRWLACHVPNVFVCYRHRKPKYSYLVWMCLKVHTHLTKGNSCEILTTNLYPFAAMSLSLSGNVNVSLSDNARLVWMWIDLQKGVILIGQVIKFIRLIKVIKVIGVSQFPESRHQNGFHSQCFIFNIDTVWITAPFSGQGLLG